MKRNLKNVTLIGVDCLDIERLKLAADICQKYFDFGSVKLLTSMPDSDSRVIPIDPITSREQYSQFCIKKMVDYIDTEFVLIIQYDGFILNPNAWTDEFFDYDYIGAPWWYDDGMNVGNGGFSLRSKKLLDIIKNADFITEYEPEDHHICRTYYKELKALGVTYAPQDVAEKFSKEGLSKNKKPNCNNVWSNEFGFHGLRNTDISNWLKANPEYSSRIQNIIEPKFLHPTK
jgi:hypothetical protein